MTQPVTYELPDPSYEDYTWILQDEHQAGVQAHVYWGGGLFAAAMQTPAGEVPSRVQIHGFMYARPEVSGQNPFGAATPPKTLEDLKSWREVWPPQIDEFARSLEGFDPASVPAGEWQNTLTSHARELGRIFSGVHLGSVITGYMAVEAFTAAYVAHFGEEGRPEALTLLQGFPNLSLERAAALWDLSRIARSDAAVLAAMSSGEALPESENGRRFKALLESALQRFGHTTNIGGGHLPTWAEDPAIPLEMVRAYARLEDGHGPGDGAARQAQERQALEQKVAAAGDADLSFKLALAQQYLPNLEDHNLICDQRLGSAVRARWMAIGRHLVHRGLEAPDDVFYYRQPELVATLEGGDLLPPEVIAERRALIASLALNPPPPVLGKPREAASGAVALEPSAARVLRGAAASPGVFTGRARIIERLEDAWRLETGDVLVARMTSPPWTPFFATIGALVVNTGGALSHGAVVAREFGIPAVVGTGNATVVIREGATVTVDGTNGVVTVEG